MGIRGKLIIAFLIVSIIPTTFIGTMSFLRSEQVILDGIINEKRVETLTKADNVDLVMEKFSKQLLILKDLPPVQGIIRSSYSGEDTFDGSTLEQWRERFEIIFSRIIEVDKEIESIRYIDANGLEIVAVSNVNGQSITSKKEDLVNQRGSTFFQPSYYQNEGSIFVSELSLKKEGLRIANPTAPILHFGTPVFDAYGTRFGAIVFTVNAQPLLDLLKRKSVGDSIVVDQDGFYLVNPDKNKLFGKDTGSGYNLFAEEPSLRKKLNTIESSDEFDKASRSYRIWQTSHYNQEQDSKKWYILSIIPESEILASIFQLRSSVITLSIIVILAALLLALLIARSMLAPLFKLTRTAEKIASGKIETRIDIDSRDEIGKLGIAFNNMAEKLIQANKQLEHRVVAKTKELSEKVEDLEESKEKVIDLLEESQKSEREIEELNLLRDKFVRIVSHQLRTPLNAIRWNLEALMAEELGELKPEQKEFIRITHDADLEIIDRIDDMLTIMDIEEGRISMSKEPTSLESLWTSVLKECSKKCIIKDIHPEFTTPATPMPNVQVDHEKISSVMRKMLDNAITYTDRSGNILSKFTLTDNRVRFEISDTGIGIPEADKKHIFDRFFRASNASIKKQDASGIGLAIAKYYISAHGGTIGFESEEGKGSTFWFEIPVKQG